MPYIDFKAAPGTIKTPQHTKSSEGRYIVTDKVHFPDGFPTPIPAFGAAAFNTGNTDDITGTCRSIWSSKLSGTQSPYRFFGTHMRLFVEYLGNIYNITPLADQKNESLGADPLDTASGDATLTITYTAHGLSVGDIVIITGAADVGGVTADTSINGVEFNVATVPDADTITVEMGVTAGSTATGGGSVISVRSIGVDTTLSNPFDTTNTSPIVTVNYTSHGLADGDRVRFSNCSAVGGVPAAELNAEHIITYVDADSFTITVATDATSTVTGGGGTSCFIYVPIAAGNEAQALGTGFGYGTFGLGILGAPFTSTSAQVYPRIWSFDNFGNDILMCPGDSIAGDGQKVYIWDGTFAEAPTILLNAPTNCNWIAVINNAPIALCGDQIRIGQIGNATVWSGVTTDTIDVQRAVGLISAHSVGEKSAIIFAPEPYLLAFVGGDWDLVELQAQYPIVAPLAAAQWRGGLMWMDNNARLCFFNGSAVDVFVNEQNGEWIRSNMNEDSSWLSFAFQDPKHNQVWFFFPTLGNDNPSDYLIFNPEPMSFTLGELDRTAAQRPYIQEGVFYMADESTAYSHFTAGSTDFNWSFQSAYFYGNGGNRFRINNIITDCFGSANMTAYGKEYPQADEVTYDTIAISGGVSNMRAAGRLLSVGFAGDSDFTFRGAKFELEQQGRRI